MIRDFKEQRKGLLRTTSSREALNRSSKASIRQAAQIYSQPHQQPMARNPSNKSRENEDREPVKHRTNTGYAQLNNHFK